MERKLEETFAKYGGVMRTSQLNHEGFYYKKIKDLLANQQIEQIRRGYYQYIGNNLFSDIPTITALFPDGVLCMDSALEHYGYTERTPSAWHVAVVSTSTRTRFYIDYPIVKPHFIQKDRYLIGITEVDVDGQYIKIYDRDRTICDLLLHRNKIDSEVFNTAVQRYVKDPEKSVARLMQYAKVLHVEKKVREVLGIWL